MRIAHVTDCYLPRLGGIEMQVHDLAAGQAASGHEVAVFTTTPGGDAGGPVQVLRAGRGGDERIHYRHTGGGLGTLAGRDFDAVHVHASSFSPFAFLAAHHASRAGVPTVATVHSLWAKATPLFRAADVLTGWSDWPVVWSAVSNAAAAPLRSILAGRAPVHILANGVDPAEWTVVRTPRPDGVLRVVAVCRLARRKRPFALVEILAAARSLLGADVRLQAEVIGEGAERERIERYLRRHGMEADVSLPGRRSRSEIRSVFARSDLFVAPASLESFGIAALEARCAGLPVLARAGTGVADFVTPGEEGWLVGSDREMVRAVVDLARRPGRLDQVAARNQAVPGRVSWSGVLHRAERLYAEAAAAHGRRWAGPAPERSSPVRVHHPVGRFVHR